MSDFDAGEQAATVLALFKEYLDLENLLQSAYDQGVADTLESSMPAESNDFFS